MVQCANRWNARRHRGSCLLADTITDALRAVESNDDGSNYRFGQRWKRFGFDVERCCWVDGDVAQRVDLVAFWLHIVVVEHGRRWIGYFVRTRSKCDAVDVADALRAVEENANVGALRRRRGVLREVDITECKPQSAGSPIGHDHQIEEIRESDAVWLHSRDRRSLAQQIT